MEEFLGQEHFLYKGSLLYNSIKNKTFDSAIFTGQSGTGKTTFARIVCREMDENFVEINASTTGTKEFKEVLEKARRRFFGLESRPTYIYVDEIHRWNKLQQDSLLKALEEGIIKLVGTTTENPYFSINNAIISRVRQIYRFKPLDIDDLVKILKRALEDEKKGLGRLSINYDEEALRLLAELSNGDTRVCLDVLGFIGQNINEDEKITKEIVSEAMQQKIEIFDNGDAKYDLLSALQKSIRGSDVDASIFYLAKLIEGGMPVDAIGRRLLVIASEDIGMAYPSAISIVESCVSAALIVGYPEARINLVHATVLLASSPKSNSAYMAYNRALIDIKTKDIGEIPKAIRDKNTVSGRENGNKQNGKVEVYLYPHDYGGYIYQQYLPDALHGNTNYYMPTENGSEKQFKKYLEGLANGKNN